MAVQVGVQVEKLPLCDFITKLGGSAITDKTKLETLKEEELDRAAAILANCYRTGKRFVVVHGAGSFGHHQAKAYSVKGGYSADSPDKARVQEGFTKTRLAVTKLNHAVVTALVGQGVPAVSLSPCGSWETDRGEVSQDGAASVCRLLQEGYIPCLHGDCVLDTATGCTILSGDIIIQVLCRTLLPKQVIFLTNVAGIFTKPPSEKDAHHIREILVRENGDFDVSMETSCNPDNDVTGGIRLKIASSAQIVSDHRGRVSVWVCGLESYGDICNFDSTNPSSGTLLKYNG